MAPANLRHVVLFLLAVVLSLQWMPLGVLVQVLDLHLPLWAGFTWSLTWVTAAALVVLWLERRR